MFYQNAMKYYDEASAEEDEFDEDFGFFDGEESQSWEEYPEPFGYPEQLYKPDYAQFELWKKFLFVAITAVVAVIVSLVLYTISGKASETGLAVASEFVNQPTPVVGLPPTATSDPILESGINRNLDCAVSDQYPNKIRQWCDLIMENANKRGLPPDLVAALIWQESGGNPNAYSQSGAVGLMQVMPRDGLAASFMCANGPCFHNRPYSDELRDPAFNISYGTKMLAGLVQKNGSLREGLKSYGPMDVGYYYADKVLGIYQRYGNN